MLEKLKLFLENFKGAWENLNNSYNDFVRFKKSALIDIVLIYE